jgi:predicted nucleic acid-binding protein
MNATDVKVVDASALAAVIFAEPEGQGIAVRLEAAKLAAPLLLDFEITNICLTKLRRNPARRTDFLSAFNLRSAFSIESYEIDYGGSLSLAEQFRLTAYDASYLWLARHLSAELVTLDRQLARAAAMLSQ